MTLAANLTGPPPLREAAYLLPSTLYFEMFVLTVFSSQNKLPIRSGIQIKLTLTAFYPTQSGLRRWMTLAIITGSHVEGFMNYKAGERVEVLACAVVVARECGCRAANQRGFTSRDQQALRALFLTLEEILKSPAVMPSREKRRSERKSVHDCRTEFKVSS